MSHYSHLSKNYEFQRSGNNGSRGISSTPGDQRDTGSGFSCPEKCCTKIIPSTSKDDAGGSWDVQLHCVELIGSGGFASVYLAHKYFINNNNTAERGWKTIQNKTGDDIKEKYAIKELIYSDERKHWQVKKVLEIESAVCSELKVLNDPQNRHENIVKPLNIIDIEKYKVGYIVMEYCAGGDLKRYMDKCDGERVSEAEARTIMAQVTKGRIRTPIMSTCGTRKRSLH